MGIFGCNLRRPLSYLKSIPLKIFVRKLKTKSCFVWVFVGWNLKILLSYLKSVPSNLSNCKLWCKKWKLLNLGSKIIYLCVFGHQFWKTTVTLEISPFKLPLLQNFVQERKCLHLGLKIPYLGIFGLEFEKIFAIFEIDTLKFLSKQSFVQNWKSLNLGPKIPNALFEYFSNNFVKLLLYLKSAPLNLSKMSF